jgi:hypothetical protein
MSAISRNPDYTHYYIHHRLAAHPHPIRHPEPEALFMDGLKEYKIIIYKVVFLGSIQDEMWRRGTCMIT